jgi:hypothetical protein
MMRIAPAVILACALAAPVSAQGDDCPSDRLRDLAVSPDIQPIHLA